MDRQHLLSFIRYEAKLLSREWNFKCMSVLSVMAVTALHLLYQSNFNQPVWASISLASTIPYANAYFINYIQTFIAIFLAGRFLFQKKSSDTTDAIRIRPYTNTEYLWGKTFGFIFLILILDGILMCIAILIHLFASESPWDFYPYFFYFFTLPLPSLLFITGLTIILKSLFRRQKIALLILCIIFYWEITQASRFLHGGFDLFSSSLPNMFSEWTGFSALGLYLMQRSIFLLWGIGFLFLSIRLLLRLSDKQKFGNYFSFVGILLILLGIISVWQYNASFHQQQLARKTARQLFAKHEKRPKVKIKNHHIRFQQSGKNFTAKSQITLFNPHKTLLPSFVLYLNPGLIITEIICNGESISFHREAQIIELQQQLSPEKEYVLQIEYNGRPTQDICYAEFDRPEDYPESRSYTPFNYGNEMFFLQKDFTLLTPEIMWYPTATPTVNVLSPYTTPKTFTEFTLEVTGEKDRQVISQGKARKSQDTVRFTNFQKLTGLSLCMGKYTCISDTLAGIITELYLFHGHENIIKNIDTKEFQKNLKNLLKPQSFFAWDEQPEYPLRKLALVETPVHFCSYGRYWKEETEQLQPELIFRPEGEAMGRKNPAFNTTRYSSSNENETPQDNWFQYYYIQHMGTEKYFPTRNLLFPCFKTRSKSSDHLKNETNISLFWENKSYWFSEELPGLNTILNSIPFILADIEQSYHYVNPECIAYFQKNSLATAFSDTRTQPFIKQLISLKTEELIKQLSLLLPFEQLKEQLKNQSEQHPFERISFEQFCEEYEKTSGINILPIIQQWYQESGIFSFRIRDLKFYATKNNRDQEAILADFKIWNKSHNDGIISVTLDHSAPQFYSISANSAKEVKAIFNKNELKKFSISTGLSQNLPNRYECTNITITSTIPIPLTGLFDTDTAVFAPVAGEYIVDNESKDFCILNNRSNLQKIIEEEALPQEKLAGSSPKKWTRYIHPQAYGEPVKSYYCKLSGTGESSIEWKTQLLTEGMYELFIFTNYDFFDYCNKAVFHKKGEKPPVRTNPITQTYLFDHSEGKERITIEINHSGNGWVSLGKYHFPAGTTKITLTDKGAYPEQNLYADAVKWIKIK